LVVPRAVIDYGPSGDAWDNVGDARRLLALGFAQGVPELIRVPPGEPLLTYTLMAVVGWGSHVATNAVIFGFYLFSVGMFHLAVRGEQHADLLAMTFGLTPIVLRDAAITQDFICGLAFILAAYAALRCRRHVLSGALLGIAVGFRLNHIIIAVPFALYALADHTVGSIRNRVLGALKLSMSTALVALCAYLPFMFYSGLGWRLVVPLAGHGGAMPVMSRMMVSAYNILYAFGPIAVTGIIAVAIWDRRRLAFNCAHDIKSRSPVFLLAVTLILLHVALCIRFTMKEDYFLPAVPFVLILIGRYFSAPALQIVAVLVISYSVVSIDLKGGISGKRVVALRPSLGLIVQDFERRREIRDLRNGVGQLVSLQKAVVMTGMGGVLTQNNPRLHVARPAEVSPRFRQELSAHRGFLQIDRLDGSNVFLIFSLSRDNLDVLRGEGYRIYMFSEFAPSATLEWAGYDPYAAGIDVLRILGPDAFYKKARSLRTARAQ